MAFAIELGKESTSVCGCCGKTSHTLRGYISDDGAPHGVYFAGYTERHEPQEGTLVISLGDWGEGSRPERRRCVALKVRVIDGRMQMMVVGPNDVPWNDIGVLGPVMDRPTALASPDLKDYFHAADHVVESDGRFTGYFFPRAAAKKKRGRKGKS